MLTSKTYLNNFEGIFLIVVDQQSALLITQIIVTGHKSTALLTLHLSQQSGQKAFPKSILQLPEFPDEDTAGWLAKKSHDSLRIFPSAPSLLC